MSYFNRLDLLDRVVFGYTAWVALLVTWFRDNVDGAGTIIALHVALLGIMMMLPPRGARWERTLFGSGRARHLRGGIRFFRHGYPLLLVVFFFEEVERTVGAIYPETPHWFERHLYELDRAVFGELPSVALNPLVGVPQDELFHGFYLSYYFILIGGVAYAYLRSDRRPSPAFTSTLTTAIVAFVLCFVWYPFLPARGPWENPELMAQMTPFRGWLFTPLIERIINYGAVSGGCFPSSHVAGSWGIALGLFRFDRRAGATLTFFALGLSFACVYTRYHHGIDVPAGVVAAVTAALLVRPFVPAPEPAPAEP